MYNLKKNLTEKEVQVLEQVYFCHDIPVPLNKIMVYPVLVKDYYKFYTCCSVLTIDKNLTSEGIPFSNLGFLIHLMEKNDEDAKIITSQLYSLFELIFHIKRGFYCSNEECEKEHGRYEIEIETIIEKLNKVKTQEEKAELFQNIDVCPYCGKKLRDIISIKTDGKNKTFSIYNEEINKQDFDYLRELVMYQNVPTWDNTEFVDPNLKKELEERDKLLNKDKVPPTLEKQEAVVIAQGCNYNFKTIQDITLRKLSILIANIDKMIHYQIYKTSEMSGMVTYKNEIEHYLYSNKKHTAADDVFTLDALKDKMKYAT